MTINAQPTLSPATVPLPSAERPTGGLGAAQPPAIDAVSLLDNRTRRHLIPAEGAPPGRYLEVDDGDGRRLISLERPIMHVGRGLIADVRLEDPHTSRRHAIIALGGEGVRVLDDRSANGTFVNGRRVTVARLSDGDVLRVGRAVFRYVEVAPVSRARIRRRFPIAPAARRRFGPPAGGGQRTGGGGQRTGAGAPGRSGP